MKTIVKTMLFGTAAAILSSCGGTDKNTPEQDLKVNVADAIIIEQSNRKEFSFMAKPFRSSELSFRVGGPIDRFEIYPGNYYKRGDIISEIDPRDFRIRKERAEGIYNQAKAEFERIKVLYEKNNISASAYEKAKADYTTAKTTFETAVNELNDTKLIAPFNGYVGEVFIEKYQDVKATQPVITFVDIDKLKIEAYVTQDIAFNCGHLKDIDLSFDSAPDKTYQAKITEISRSTTRNNLSYLLTATLPNENGKLLPGMSGKIYLNPGETSIVSGIAIPQSAVRHTPQEGDYAWVIDKQSGKASKRQIVLGKLQPANMVSVTSGLKKGETVATSSLRFLSEGMNVQISGGKNTVATTTR